MATNEVKTVPDTDALFTQLAAITMKFLNCGRTEVVHASDIDTQTRHAHARTVSRTRRLRLIRPSAG